MDSSLNRRLFLLGCYFIALYVLRTPYIAQNIQAIKTGAPSTFGPPLPSTISNLMLWLSADCITFSSGACQVPADNTAVTLWHDRSGQFNNAGSFTGTCTFHTNQVNGQPAISVTNCKAALMDDTNSWLDAFSFTGSGLNDAAFTFQGGHYAGIDNTAYCFKIDGTGTPDTYSWGTGGSCTNGGTGAAITGSAQSTGTNLPQVTFGATTGHTLNNNWTFSARGLGSHSVTEFVVLKVSTEAARQQPSSPSVSCSSDPRSFAYWFYNSSTHGQGADACNKAELGYTTVLLGTTNWHQTNVAYSDGTASNSLAFRMDRSVAATTKENSNTLSVGAQGGQTNILYDEHSNGNPMTGQIAEIIYFQKLLSPTEITTVETYLNSKYGL